MFAHKVPVVSLPTLNTDVTVEECAKNGKYTWFHYADNELLN